MDALLLTVVSVCGAGFIGFLTAFMTGMIVPGYRLKSSEKAFDVLNSAHEKLKESFEEQKELVRELKQQAMLTNAMSEAVRKYAELQSGGDKRATS